METTVDKADLVLHDGSVFGHPESDSVAIAKGKVVAHGRYRDLKALVGPRTHLIPLAGRAVTPGFIDSHLHFMEGASVAAGLSVIRCRTIEELLADLRVGTGKSPAGNWLRAFGCDETLLQDRRGPTRAELDQAVPKNPLRLRHQTLHGSWLNSRAIAQLGMEQDDFRPPAGAYIGRDERGRLSGFVAGMEEWISDRLPRVTRAELESRARFFSRELASAGITAFTDATARNGLDEISTLARLVAGGSISQHTSAMVGASNLEAVPTIRQIAASAGIGLLAAKFIDASRWEMFHLTRAVAIAMTAGIDCAFHATEVEELEAALRAVEAARERVPRRSLEQVVPRIEHGGLIPPDYPERIAAAGAWVVTNPGFVFYRGGKYAGEPGLIPYLYRARSLAAAGVDLAGGTDAPVTPARPLAAIAAAMARISIEGYELAPSEMLSAAESFALFTSSAARLSRLNAGEIEIGRRGDLIVLPADPLRLAPAELLNLPVDLTIIGGRVVYERGRPLMSQSPTASLFSA
jgi:predicted amidohydrolase YtcJ